MRHPVFIVREENHLPGLFGVYLNCADGGPRIASSSNIEAAYLLAHGFNERLSGFEEAYRSFSIDI